MAMEYRTAGALLPRLFFFCLTGLYNRTLQVISVVEEKKQLVTGVVSPECQPSAIHVRLGVVPWK